MNLQLYVLQNELGYDDYPKLQRALEELVKNRLTSVQRMEVAYDRLDQKVF